MITEPRITDPTLNERAEQPTVGIKQWVGMDALEQVIPTLFSEVYRWMTTRDIAPAGARFIRYHAFNMPHTLEIEVGFPVAAAAAGDERISAGVIPAGRYASVLHTGDYSTLTDAGRVLLDWAQDNGITWDHWRNESGDHFAARLEHYITDPGQQPDPSKWETEVAIKLADR